MSDYMYDVLIIGAGPGGYVGAIRAAQLGLSVCLVEKHKVGGVCLNIGCIPSKSLIHQAEAFRHISDLLQMGITVDTSAFSYKKVFEKSRTVSENLSKGVSHLLKKNSVELIEGTAFITGAHNVTVDGTRLLTAGSILIATGSLPRQIPGFEFDEDHILSSTGALMSSELPKSICILGGGAIGCEFAHILNAFGVEVTLIEMLDHILPLEMEETAKHLMRSFKKRKIKVYTKTKALSQSYRDGICLITLEDAKGKQKVIEAQKLMVVVGRVPNTKGLGLEAIGVETERGFIQTGSWYESTVESIYGIGDVTSSPLLAHVASKEAEIAVEHIAGLPALQRIDPLLIPTCVYTEPQVASFGHTRASCEAAGITVKIAAFPYRASGKAQAVEAVDGEVRIIADAESDLILGAAIVGADATEMIGELLVAKEHGLTVREVSSTIHAHPTLSESLAECLKAIHDEAIHM